MKIVIEIEQEFPNTQPTIRVTADGKPVGPLEELQLEVRARNLLPYLKLEFSRMEEETKSGLHVSLPWADITHAKQ